MSVCVSVCVRACMCGTVDFEFLQPGCGGSEPPTLEESFGSQLILLLAASFPVLLLLSLIIALYRTAAASRLPRQERLWRLRVGDKVRHSLHGPGVVQAIHPDEDTEPIGKRVNTHSGANFRAQNGLKRRQHGGKRQTETDRDRQRQRQRDRDRETERQRDRQTHTHTQTHTQTHTHRHTHTYARGCTRTHAHTHTRAQALKQVWI